MLALTFPAGGCARVLISGAVLLEALFSEPRRRKRKRELAKFSETQRAQAMEASTEGRKGKHL